MKQWNPTELVLEKEILKNFRIVTKSKAHRLNEFLQTPKEQIIPSYANCIKTQTRLDFI